MLLEVSIKILLFGPPDVIDLDHTSAPAHKVGDGGTCSKTVSEMAAGSLILL